MNRTILRAAVISLSLLLFPLTILAWNPTGHMVIGNIAYKSVSASTRSKIDKIVAYLNEQYPEINTLSQAASWPDAIRAQRIETYSHWHYVDIAMTTDGSPLKNLIDTDNAVYELANIEVVTKNTKANPYERTRFLAFLAHIVGDLHQPLHTVSNITAKNPDGDKGGNLFYVRVKNNRINLHKLWDDGLGAFESYATPQAVDSITKSLMAKYPASYFGNKVDDLKPSDWADEGVKNAKQYVYATKEDQTPANNYMDTGRQIAEQQASLAGYRLAKLIDELLA